MPLLSSYLLITTHALAALTASYLLLTRPSLIVSSSPIWVLGESMHIRPPPPSFSVPSEAIAAAAFALALAALSQLFFVGGLGSIDTNSSKAKENGGAGTLGEQVAVQRASQSSWMSLAATRVFVMGGLAMWIYLMKSNSGTIIDSDTVGGVKGLGLLANSAVFTAAMGEMLFWGYVWTVLKEERSGLAKTVMQGREGRQAVLNQDGTVTWE